MINIKDITVDKNNIDIKICDDGTLCYLIAVINFWTIPLKISLLTTKNTPNLSIVNNRIITSSSEYVANKYQIDYLLDEAQLLLNKELKRLDNGDYTSFISRMNKFEEGRKYG